jgi:hypothetical protein
MDTGGKRRELYIKELKDHIQLLKLSYFYFQEYYPDDERTLNQIRKIGNYCVTLIIKRKKIVKPLIKKISEYTNIMVTFDKKQIQQSGRDLLKYSKTVK